MDNRTAARDLRPRALRADLAPSWTVLSTRRAGGSRAGTRRPRPVLSAPGRGSRSSPSGTRPASPGRVGVVDGPVIEDEGAEALALGQVPNYVGAALAGIAV